MEADARRATTHVPTVLGDVPTDSLGVTLMHEHVFTLNTEVELNDPSRFDEDVRRRDAVRKLQALIDRGCRTLVDLTVLGIGRDIGRIQKVAAEVDADESRDRLNIVVATGYYTWHSLPSYFESRGPGRLAGGPDPLVTWFLRDIREGIAGTGVRAGILKCATDVHGVTPAVERVLRAVAITHRETGVPISTHANALQRRGLEQQAVLESEGVDLSRVVIGHSGDTTDIDYIRALMDAGSFVGMDRFGLNLAEFCTKEERIDTVARLCELGYAGQMVLSHDASCFGSFMDPDVKKELFPDWEFTYLFETVIPELLRRGVSEDQLHQMLVENPRRVFESVSPY